MANTKKLLLPAILWIFCSCFILNPTIATSDGFLDCLSEHHLPSRLVYTRSSPSYTSILKSAIRNPVFFYNITSKPLYIITPESTAHIQTAVLCGRRHKTRLRVRSGGHDYVGLSYRSEDEDERFVTLDLSRMRSVRVDAERGTAWVQSGATLGELYYAIHRASPRLGFPAGVCPTVGVGGHFSGGAFGMLQRKYGLAVDDHIVNATMVDADGNLLHRDTMGVDLFWAIRGGGGGNFGVVVSWHVKLVPVPATVTIFDVQKTLDQGAIDLITKWQTIAPNMTEDIMVRAVARPGGVEFQSLYLGTCDQMLPLMRDQFPDLGIKRTHCREMTWIESVPYIHLGPDATVADILNRSSISAANTKNKSDFVLKAIPKAVWKKIFGRLAEATRFGDFSMFVDPYGGKIGSVDESATPFPHRKDVLYNIQYITFWKGAANGTLAMKWTRDLYEFMEPYVSQNPRQAYVNYRDIDLGRSKVVNGISSYDVGKVWGERYFSHNFDRLARMKAKVDPHDYFRNEQSIPPFRNG